MKHKKFPHMFEPMIIKGLTFKNRVIASPITTNRIVDHGYPSNEGIDVYETKARGGFGVVTITESFVDDEFASRHEHGLNVYSKNMTTFHMESIMTLTEAIKAHGAIASIQLNHVGAMNHPSEIKGGLNPIGPSAYVRADGIQVDAMTEAMMERVAENYAEAAWNCKALGFQMINLHGGHGWLLNQFISPAFNKRQDQYGGSMENRARFPIMVCNRIKEKCGDDLLIEYRMSGSERVEGGMTLDDGIAFAKLIQDHVDLIHVTSGVYYDHVGSKAFSSMFDPHGCNLDLAEAIKKNVTIPVVAVGGFNQPDQIEEAIASGKCDFVAMGRQQFADPDFVNKTLEGREEEIGPCLRCSCFNPLAPDPNQRPIPKLWHCRVNPWAGRELRWRQAPKPRQARKVLVLGGGVAGMYAAYTAAERGHIVTLIEKENKLGGQLSFTDFDYHKESLEKYKKALIARCKHEKVDIRLGKKFDKNDIEELQPEVVINAIGSVGNVPLIKGIEFAQHVTDLYGKENEIIGQHIAIIGGGAIGCESGYFFASEYKAKLSILEVREDIIMDTNDSQRRALIPRMKKAGMDIYTKASVVSIDYDDLKSCYSVNYINGGNEEVRLEADRIAYACGSHSRSFDMELLEDYDGRYLEIGDGKKARTVLEATYEGFCAAMDIV